MKQSGSPRLAPYLSSTPHPSFDISSWKSPFILLLALVLILVPLFLVLNNKAKLRVKLELAFQGVDLGRHGHNLLIIRKFGSPLTLILEPVKVGLLTNAKNGSKILKCF